MASPTAVLDMDMEMPTDQQPLVGPLGESGQGLLRRPVVRLAALGIATASACALVYAAPWKAAGAPALPGTWLQSAQRVDEARSRALQQVRSRAASTLSKATLAKDETEATTEACDLVKLAADECALNACSKDCMRTYTDMQYMCSGSKHADVAKDALKGCSEMLGEPSAAVPPPALQKDHDGGPEVQMSDEDMMKCMPTILAMQSHCDMESESPNFQAICSTGCQDALKGAKLNCAAVFGGSDHPGEANPLDMMIAMCSSMAGGGPSDGSGHQPSGSSASAGGGPSDGSGHQPSGSSASAGGGGLPSGSCSAAVGKLFPGSPAMVACNVKPPEVDPKDITGCASGCRPTLCQISKSCQVPKGGDEELADMHQNIEEATKDCPCDAA